MRSRRDLSLSPKRVLLCDYSLDKKNIYAPSYTAKRSIPYFDFGKIEKKKISPKLSFHLKKREVSCHRSQIGVRSISSLPRHSPIKRRSISSNLQPDIEEAELEQLIHLYVPMTKHSKNMYRKAGRQNDDMSSTGFKSISRCPKINLRPRSEHYQIDDEPIVRDSFKDDVDTVQFPVCNFPSTKRSDSIGNHSENGIITDCLTQGPLSVDETSEKIFTPYKNESDHQDKIVECAVPLKPITRTRQTKPLGLAAQKKLFLPPL